MKIAFSLGVSSRSMPSPASSRPGFTKLAWPSNLFERRLGSSVPGPFSRTFVWVRAIAERLQKLNGPPAKLELS